MNNPHLQEARDGQVFGLVLLAMFTAIIFILAFTPIGLIDLPLIKATILHVPVIIGSILLGPKKGAFLGFVFGAVSLFKNTMAPSALSFAFSPFIPVLGTDHGSLWALIICFVPRILVGVTPWLMYTFIRKALPGSNPGIKAAGMAVSAVVGAFTNTALVMGMIYLVFSETYAAVNGIPVDAVLGVILGVVAANGIPEAIVAAVITPAVTVPLAHLLRSNRLSAVLTEPN